MKRRTTTVGSGRQILFQPPNKKNDPWDGNTVFKPLLALILFGLDRLQTSKYIHAIKDAKMRGLNMAKEDETHKQSNLYQILFLPASPSWASMSWVLDWVAKTFT